MPLRKAIDLTIADGDGTTAALDLAPYNGLALKVGAITALDANTATLKVTGCDTSAGTYTEITGYDGTTGFGILGLHPEMEHYPRYLQVACDTAATAAAGLAVTAYVNMVNP